jgi:RimJ/RimL family protein N-acetyltransferase
VDAAALAEAVVSSLDHLRPWMPWVHDEPQAIDQKIGLLRGFRSRFDADQDFVYGVFDRNDVTVVGGAGLHTRVGDDALEIGYWIRESEVRRGLATEVAAALTRAAFLVAEVERVEIHVTPANVASCRVAEKLGFRAEATLRRRAALAPGGPKQDLTIFTMTVEDFVDSEAHKLSESAIAYDAVGRCV